MQKFQTAVTRPTGDVIPNAVVTVLTLAGAPATIYSDNGTTLYPTNQLITDSQGEFSFYAENGRYSYTVAAVDFVTETYADFILYDPDDAANGLSVAGFGAVGDGVTNDTIAFQTAADYAGLQKGGDIYVPPGTYLISSTIIVNTANVGFVGAGGSAYLHNSAPRIAEATVTLRWVGTAGGTVMRFISDGGVSGKKQSGGGVKNICFDSGFTTFGTGASYALNISSWTKGCFEYLYFYEFQIAGMLFDTVPFLSDARDPNQNRTINCYSYNVTNSNGGMLKLYGDRTGNALWNISTSYLKNDLVSYSGASYVALENNLGFQPNINPAYWVAVTGSSATGANVSINHFEQLRGYFNNGNWLDIYNTDHNYFINTAATRVNTGTGYCIAFHGSDFTTDTVYPYYGKVARYNMFIAFNGGAEARAYGNPTYLYPSHNNIIYDGASTNGFPSTLNGLFIVDSGASVYCTDDTFTAYRSNNIQSFFYPYASQDAFNSLSGAQTRYPYNDNTSASAYFFNNGVIDNAVFTKYTTGGTGIYYPQYEFSLRVGVNNRFSIFQGSETTVAWSPSTSYVIGDLAFYSGLSYKALTSNTNAQPDISPSDWTVIAKNERLRVDENGNIFQMSKSLLGYSGTAGAGIQQTVSRTSTVTLNAPCGYIRLFGANGSTTPTSFTVNNSFVTATDTIILTVRNSNAVNDYIVNAIDVADTNTFKILFYTTGGTAFDSPFINFAIIKAVA